jgi:hypothetical protein
MMDKPEIKKKVQKHYQHKVEKLRERIHRKQRQDEKLQEEALQREKEEKENLVFRIADESFASLMASSTSEEQQPTCTKFDYHVNESRCIRKSKGYELINEIKAEQVVDTENGRPCGEKIGNRILLRGHQDRLYKEPRGRVNLYQINESKLRKAASSYQV